MQTLTRHGHLICGHVHDEVIIEAPKGATPDEICNEMAQAPPWLPGIILKAEGYTAEWYKKMVEKGGAP